MAEPLSDPHPKRVPTTVVAGVDPRLRARLIRQLAAGRPGGERWAWIGSDLRADGPDDDAGGSERPVDDPAFARFAVAGGCACCLAGPAFRVSLARVLREGRWNRVIIDVASGGHPDRVVDQVRTPPFDGHLIVTAMPLVVGPSEWPLYRPGRSPGAVDPASDTLDGGSGDDALVADGGDDLLRGGDGLDLFILDDGGGTDRIADFAPGLDRLYLAQGLNGLEFDGGSIFAVFSQRLAADGAGGTIIDLGAGNAVILEGVEPATLTAADFYLFAT